jgi:hypothetical protein
MPQVFLLAKVAMLQLDWQKLKAAPFIHAGVTFFMTLGDK